MWKFPGTFLTKKYPYTRHPFSFLNSSVNLAISGFLFVFNFSLTELIVYPFLSSDILLISPFTSASSFPMISSVSIENTEQGNLLNSISMLIYILSAFPYGLMLSINISDDSSIFK